MLISEALHWALVAVDEEGTKAEGATAGIVPTSAMPRDPVQVTVDRPLILLIRHRRTGTMLSVGRVLDRRA